MSDEAKVARRALQRTSVPESLRVARPMIKVGKDLPEVPAPPSQIDPMVIGSSDFAKLVREMFNLAPTLRDKVKVVEHRPTFEPDTYGMFEDRAAGASQPTITIDSWLEDDPGSMSDQESSWRIPSILDTLIHEMAHAAGKDEYDARKTEEPVSHFTTERAISRVKRRRK